MHRIGSWFPEAKISMKYKMPTFEIGQNWVALANQKHYISVYTCAHEHISSFTEKHPEIKCGKGCLNFKDKDKFYFSDLKSVVSKALRMKK